jgi:hypothetical protein
MKRKLRLRILSKSIADARRDPSTSAVTGLVISSTLLLLIFRSLVFIVSEGKPPNIETWRSKASCFTYKDPRGGLFGGEAWVSLVVSVYLDSRSFELDSRISIALCNGFKTKLDVDESAREKSFVYSSGGRKSSSISTL